MLKIVFHIVLLVYLLYAFSAFSAGASMGFRFLETVWSTIFVLSFVAMFSTLLFVRLSEKWENETIVNSVLAAAIIYPIVAVLSIYLITYKGP